MGVFEPAPPRRRINLGDEPEFDLGAIRVKPAECIILMNGESRELQPRMMQVLVALAEARPAVVSRERLIERCWGGRIVGDDSLNRCILGLRHHAQQFVPPPFAIETVPRVGYRLTEQKARPRFVRSGRTAKLIGGSALAAALAVAILVVPGGRHPASGAAQGPTVLITGSPGDPSSGQLARDLAIKLGTLEGAHAASMRLVAPKDGDSRPDLVLQVADDPNSGVAGADLVLMDSREAMLWSKALSGTGNRADLRQLMAFTATTILACATEGMGASAGLGHQTLKAYLDACATMADAKYEPLKALHLLESVVRDSPRFTPAWAKLLTAETDAVSNVTLSDAAALRPVLARHIDMARKLEPDLAEAYIAEFILTPPSDFPRRGRLPDAAVARNPSHGSVRAERAVFLESVGRMDDAVQDAVQAIKLDPLSPITRDTYIRVLAFAGRTAAAQAALKDADALWPGAASLQAARYAVNLRVGDPARALEMLRSGAVPTRDMPLYTSFLEARIDRSPAKIDEAIRQSRSAYRNNPRAIIGYSQSMAEFGRVEEWFSVLMTWRRMDLVDDIADSLFRPAFAAIHRDARFIRVASHLGLLSYWSATGHWPDFCFAPDLPYDCKAEAAKISGRSRTA